MGRRCWGKEQRWLALLLLVRGRYCWGDRKGRKRCWWVSFGLWDKEIGEDGESVVVGRSFWSWWVERGKAGVVLGLFGWLGSVGEGEVREEIKFWPAEREDCWSIAGWRGKPRILKDQRGFSGLAKRREIPWGRVSQMKERGWSLRKKKIKGQGWGARLVSAGKKYYV